MRYIYGVDDPVSAQREKLLRREHRFKTLEFFTICMVGYVGISIIPIVTLEEMKMVYAGYFLGETICLGVRSYWQDDFLKIGNTVVLDITLYAIVNLAVTWVVSVICSAVTSNVLGFEKTCAFVLMTTLSCALMMAWMMVVKPPLLGWRQSKRGMPMRNLTPKETKALMQIGDYGSLRPEPNPTELAKSGSTNCDDELWPMTGELTPAVLRHNLGIAAKRGTEARYGADKLFKFLDHIQEQYDKLDQLETLGVDEVLAAKTRREFDAMSAKTYAQMASIVKLLMLVSPRWEASDEANTRIMDLTGEFWQNNFEEPLVKLALSQAEDTHGPTTADEIVRLKELGDSILSGSRGDKPITMAEIYPDDID